MALRSARCRLFPFGDVGQKREDFTTRTPPSALRTVFPFPFSPFGFQGHGGWRHQQQSWLCLRGGMCCETENAKKGKGKRGRHWQPAYWVQLLALRSAQCRLFPFGDVGQKRGDFTTMTPPSALKTVSPFPFSPFGFQGHGGWRHQQQSWLCLRGGMCCGTENAKKGKGKRGRHHRKGDM
jgi:hypothetical protein